jgi:hypothetical protein
LGSSWVLPEPQYTVTYSFGVKKGTVQGNDY